MLGESSRTKKSSFAALAVLVAIALAWSAATVQSKTRPAAQPASAETTQAESLAAWNQIAQVLDNPRCLNCHQLNSPLQGDSRRPHIPHVVRGPDNHGVGAMRCGNCHNDTGNNDTSRTPGGLHWQLAPVSMLWQGLSSADLCRALLDKSKNGNRSPEDLIEHMDKEPLVLYGWDPGRGRKPVPISHADFMVVMRTWVATGTACPQ